MTNCRQWRMPSLFPVQTLRSSHITLVLLAGSVALNALYFQPANSSSSISLDWSQILVVSRDIQKKRTVLTSTNHHVLVVRSWMTFLCCGLLVCSVMSWRKAWISSANAPSSLADSTSNLLQMAFNSSFLIVCGLSAVSVFPPLVPLGLNPGFCFLSFPCYHYCHCLHCFLCYLTSVTKL